jgi:hypothetical protein
LDDCEPIGFIEICDGFNAKRFTAHTQTIDLSQPDVLDRVPSSAYFKVPDDCNAVGVCGFARALIAKIASKRTASRVHIVATTKRILRRGCSHARSNEAKSSGSDHENGPFVE